TNTFSVTEGTVTFGAPGQTADDSALQDASAAPEGRLHVVATGTVTDFEGLHGVASQNKDVKILATVTGSLTNWNYTFQSDPPDYSQAEIEDLLGKPSLFYLAPFAQTTAGASNSVQAADLVRAFVPGVVNFFVKEYLNGLVDPYVSKVFSDYGVNVVSNTAELQQQEAESQLGAGQGQGQSLLSGYDLSLYLETVELRRLPTIGKWPVLSALPLTVSYRYTYRPSFAKQPEINSLGLNYRLPFTPKLLDMPLAVTLSGVVENNDYSVAPGQGSQFPLFGRIITLAPNNNPAIVTTAQVGLQGRF
ncbi:MAG: translocation/assembly module TamB domain-containing protein, partial [Cyanobacteria bacterium REEB65]|nr:translocation/assembly module TamB domain-containing protein [Cyanobacteria bacterium REEB65]